ncbi:MAG: hypothetical protein R3D02_14250 [Hyphomicrobiales bacterium]
MTKGSTLKTARRAVFALAGASFVFASSAALAGDLENKIFGSVFGLVGAGQPKEPIDYQPRSPLVLPPSNELPSPSEGAAAGGGDLAAWPNDPDEAARQARLAEQNRPVNQKVGDEKRSDRLSPEQLAAGRIPGAGIPDGRPRDGASAMVYDERKSARLSPTELRRQYVDMTPEPEYGPDGLPVRRRLVEPPSEYRIPAGTAEYDVKAAKKSIEEKTKAPINDRNALR